MRQTFVAPSSIVLLFCVLLFRFRFRLGRGLGLGRKCIADVKVVVVVVGRQLCNNRMLSSTEIR